MPAHTAPRTHRWRFFRAGGVDQVRLDTGADLVNLESLDQKLWFALSCPVKGLEFDERTLQLLDTDGDGRVRVPEILAAVKWIREVLKNPDELIQEKDGVPLASIDASRPEGKTLLGAARMFLENLGKAEAKEITVADAMETVEVFSNAKVNGDGIVPPDTVDDAEARAVAADVVACLGGKPDRSGKPGVDEEMLEHFHRECAAFDEWWKKGEADKTAWFLGADTSAAWTALEKVRAKIDDFFARCRLAAFDPRALAPLSGKESTYAEISGHSLAPAVQEVAHLPLQRVAAGASLDLTDGTNPAWASAVAALRQAVVGPTLGQDRTVLSEAEWSALKARFGSCRAWMDVKAGAAVERLGISRVRKILGSQARVVLLQAIAKDRAVSTEADAVAKVELLTRLYRDLHHLLVNFVSFEDFYSRRRKAVFQTGTLYLDGRSCDLCVRVGDAGRHGTLASLAKTYLAYCECTRPSGEKMTIAAAFTAGDSDHLLVGRNGLFYDRKGRDWDATISRVVENPISIGQAFWAPYKRFLRWIEEQVAKRAAAADAAATQKLTSAATATGEAASTGKVPEQKPKFDVGVVAALGVAVGGITAALGMMLEVFFGLGFWMPLGIVALLLLISGPSMLIAWLKLRQRNLGPILDANGWAVNGRARVNIPLGASLTATATLPSDSERSLVDPFAPKKRRWPKVLLVLIVLGLVVFGLHRAGVEPIKGWIDQGLDKVFPPEGEPAPK